MAYQYYNMPTQQSSGLQGINYYQDSQRKEEQEQQQTQQMGDILQQIKDITNSGSSNTDITSGINWGSETGGLSIMGGSEGSFIGSGSNTGGLSLGGGESGSFIGSGSNTGFSLSGGESGNFLTGLSSSGTSGTAGATSGTTGATSGASSASGASSGLGAGGIAAIVAAAIAGQHALSEDTNREYEGVETADAFEGHFGTEPWLAWASDKMGNEATAGERFDAAVKNDDWGAAAERGGEMIDYWFDPGSTWLEELGKGLGMKDEHAEYMFNPIGEFQAWAGDKVF